MSAAMTEFDFIKLVILIWFLAPFGYNASDMIFDLVSISNVREERMSELSNISGCHPPHSLNISGCHPPHSLPHSHARPGGGERLVQIPLLPRCPAQIRRIF